MVASTSLDQGLPLPIGISFLQSTINLAEELKTKVKAGQFQDIDPSTKALYAQGLQMIQGEVISNRLYQDDESVMPIITRLEAIIANPDVNHQMRIIKKICKSYRVFIELRAHEPWLLKIKHRSEEMPIDSLLRDQFITTSQKVETTIRRRTKAVTAIFELRCARQAARGLTPTQPLWQKYCLFIADAASTVQGLTVDTTALWKTFKNFVSSVRRDNRLAEFFWYEDIKIARWESTAIHTLNGYNQTIVPRIAAYKLKGSNHSLCLVKIFMSLIRNPDVNPEVKERAFQGDETVEGLIHALNWEPEKMPRGFLKKSVDSLKSFADTVVRTDDRYSETRELAIYYLGKIATKTKYPEEFRQISQAALRVRQSLLNDRRTGLSIVEEKERLQERLVEVNQAIERLTDDYVTLGGEKLHFEEHRTLPRDMGGECSASIQDRVGLQTSDPEIIYEASKQLLALKSECLNELHTEAENELNEITEMLAQETSVSDEFTSLSSAIDESEMHLIEEMLNPKPEIRD